MEKAESRTEGITSLFKVLSKPDALKIFQRTSDGINNSTYAIKYLYLTPKRYYARLSELVDIGLVRKYDNAYRQTGLGRMIYDYFLPAMEKAVDVKDELEFIMDFEKMDIDNGLRRRILEEIGIPIFSDSTNVKVLGDYESLAIEAIDLYDSAEESVLLASNYLDVRVMEACFRAVDRTVTNRIIMGKNKKTSKIQNLRTIFSLTFTKALINFASNKVNIKDTVRFVDLPYTFCVVDGHRNLIEISNTLNERFIVALSIDDRGYGEKLTDFYNALWEAGEFQSAIEALNSLRSS